MKEGASTIQKIKDDLRKTLGREPTATEVWSTLCKHIGMEN